MSKTLIKKKAKSKKTTSKVYKLGKEDVTIVQELTINVAQAGKSSEYKPLVDKHGTWVQIEFLTGKRKGCRMPATKESLR